MAKKKIEQTITIEPDVTVATDSEVLEGTVIGFTARSDGTVDLILKVKGKYEDFQIENKFDLKKK